MNRTHGAAAPAGGSLVSLAQDLVSGAVRVIDLTQTLSPEFPKNVSGSPIRALALVPHGGNHHG
jgi:hypothetical protein